MKKSLLVATALAVSSIAGSAAALDVGQMRSLQVDGIGRTLGTLTLTPMGVEGRYCDYLAAWESPYNPNDVNLCLLQELRTPFAPSCILNERADITTIVLSGPGACAGFNIKGESTPDVRLILGESECGLTGVAMFMYSGFSQTYPVRGC